MSNATESGPSLKLVADQRPPKPASTIAAQDHAVRIDALLKVEAAFRDAQNLKVLKYTLVCETRDILPFGQAFLFCEKRKGKLSVDAVSGASDVVSDAPLLQWLTAIVNRMCHLNDSASAGPVSFHVKDYTKAGDVDFDQLPFREALWVPLCHMKKGMFAGVLLLRTKEWQKSHEIIADRMRGTAAHAWLALTGESRLRKRFSFNRYALVGALILLIASFIPVPLRVLAPFEITPKQPSLITAPLSGTIADIKMSPNTKVRKGDVVFSFEKTELENEFLLAKRRLSVVKARRHRLEQTAISDREAKSELATVITDEKLAQAEHDYAQLKLERVDVRAKMDGLLLYSDEKDWIGKPVQTGELVMRVADPSNVEATVDLPIADDIVLQEKLPVRLFLNSNPLNPHDGIVYRVAHEARATSADTLSYKVNVKLEPGEDQLLIGNRGVAQIQGQQVSLFFFVMRRPITAARQYFGF